MEKLIERIQAFDPDRQGTKTGGHSPAELAGEFETLRLQSLKSIGTLVETDPDRRVRHQELGPVTLREFYHQQQISDSQPPIIRR